MLRKFVYSGVVLLLAGGVFSNVQAQKWEIYPYAGGFFPRVSSFGDVKSEGLYGLKGGVNLTPGFELEGNLGYINHFRAQNVDTKSRAGMFEIDGNWQLAPSRVKPFLSGGVGVMRATVGNSLLSINNNGGPNSTRLFGRPFASGDKYFMVSYGGGLKAERLWGPVGLRADVRGRTLPNIFGTSMTWLETTGGITISWGE